MKLFRRIRQGLLSEGRVKKYLLYAIGEIMLVVIGILIALQINNWNDNRIIKGNELSSYQNIKNRIADDRNRIQGNIDYNNRYKEQYEYGSKIIGENDRSKLDTLGIIAANLTRYSDFNKQGNIYETLVNSGEIKLLSNIQIVNGIRELEEKYLYINRMENIHYDVMINYAAPGISNDLNFSTGQIQTPDHLYTFKFQNLIIMLLQIMQEKDQAYNSAMDEIDRVTELINEELNHH